MGLNLVEKLWLTIRGRADAKKGLFQACDLREYHPEILIARKVFLSSFIMTELSGFNSRVISCFGRILCKPGRWARLMRSKKALDWCDSKISDIESNISKIISRHSTEISNIEHNICGSGSHIETLKKQKVSAVICACNEEKNRLLKEKISILNEKSKILNKMIIKINSLSAKSYLCSCFYYGQARKKKPDMPVLFLREEEYIILCSSSVLNDCVASVKSVERDRADTLKRIESACNICEENEGNKA